MILNNDLGIMTMSIISKQTRVTSIILIEYFAPDSNQRISMSSYKIGAFK
jgi:hypothetical protein